MLKVRSFIRASIIGDLYFLILGKGVNSYSKIKRVRALFERHIPSSFKVTYDKDLDYIFKKNGIMLNSFGTQGLYAYLNSRTQAASEVLGKLNYKKKFFKESVLRIVLPQVARIINHKKVGGATDPEYLLAEDLSSAIKIIQSPFVLKFLDRDQVRKICADPLSYCELVLQLVYLFLFNAIFVSGEFDARFDSESLEMQLSDFSEATKI